MGGRNLKFQAFWCHLKFLKFNLAEYFINCYHFENFQINHQKKGILTKEFEFPQKIILPRDIPNRM
jgi:hypothetical protein